MHARRWPLGLITLAALAAAMPASALASGECTIPKGETSCTVQQSFGGVIVTKAAPLINVKVTSRDTGTSSTSGDCASLTYRLYIKGKLAYETSLLPGQDNYDGPGQSTAGDNVGSYKPGTYPYKETFEFRVGPGCPPGLDSYSGAATSGLFTFGRGKPGYVLNVSALDLLAEGAGVRRYTGNDWDPDGKPIQVFYGRKKIKTFPASSTFRGTLPAGFSGDSCAAELKVTQGRITRRITAQGTKAETVVLADGAVRVKGGRSLKTGDTVCDGETVDVGGRAAFVGKAIGSKPRYLGLRVINNETDVAIPGGLVAPSIVMSLSRGRTTKIAGQTVAIGPYDPQGGALNFRTIPPGGADALTLTGLARTEGDLTVAGSASLDNALLYVTGSLTVKGGVKSVGAAIFAGRDLELEGAVAAQSDAEDGVSVVAGRTIFLVGRGGGR